MRTDDTDHDTQHATESGAEHEQLEQLDQSTNDAATEIPHTPAWTLMNQLQVFLERAKWASDHSPAVELIFHVLRAASTVRPGEPVSEPQDEIFALVTAASAETRTSATQLASALLPILTRIRSILLATKAELDDPDVAHGDAEVTPDGWLIVTMGGKDVGRVPFNPERPKEEATQMAEDMLSEYVRLHVASNLEVQGAELPADPGERTEITTEGGGRRRRVLVFPVDESVALSREPVE